MASGSRARRGAQARGVPREGRRRGLNAPASVGFATGRPRLQPPGWRKNSNGSTHTTVGVRRGWLLEAAHAVGLKPAACRAKAAAAAEMRQRRSALQRVARGFSRRAGGRTPTVVLKYQRTNVPYWGISQ
jgi:hypothetical protein